MKTPREILLERHRSANANLDEIRRQTLGTLPTGARRRGGEAQPIQYWPVRVALVVCRELIWPCRMAWTALAVVWLILLGVNRLLFDNHETAPSANFASAPSILQTIEEQKRLLAELIPRPNGQPVESPGSTPQPLRRHSEIY